MAHSIILTIVRHGQTSGNVNRRVEGITDTPLNENGLSQAKRAGEWLKDEIFDIVYTSDLKRAKQTASIIVHENTKIEKDDDNFVELALLRERDFGAAEGISGLELAANAAKEGFKLQKMFLQDYTPEGAETHDDVRRRAESFLDRVCELAKNSDTDTSRVLVASHGLVIAHLIQYIYEQTKCEGVPIDVMENGWSVVEDKTKMLLMIENTSITRFEFQVDEKTLKIKFARCNLFRSTSHLSKQIV